MVVKYKVEFNGSYGMHLVNDGSMFREVMLNLAHEKCINTV